MSQPSTIEKKQAARLRLVLVLVSIFFVGELTGAILSRSAVLKADALHMLMDVFALGLSLVAVRVASRAATKTYTFGFRRVEALAAVLNGFLVLATAVEIVRDGIESLSDDVQPDGELMLYVSLVALVVNSFAAWLLHGSIGHHGHSHGHHGRSHDHDHHGHDHNHDHDHEHHHTDAAEAAHVGHGHELNLRGAALHLIGDALGAVAAVIAALVIRAGGPVIIDIIAGAFVACILTVGAIRLLRDAARVLLEGAPRGLDLDAVRAALAALPEVKGVHDLRVWSLGTGHNAVTVRLTPTTSTTTLGELANAELKRAFSFSHITVQVDAAQTVAPSPRSVH